MSLNSVIPHLPVLLSLLKAWLPQWRFLKSAVSTLTVLDLFPFLFQRLSCSGCRWWGSQFPPLVPPTGTLGLFALGIQPSVSTRCHVDACQRRFHLPEAYPCLKEARLLEDIIHLGAPRHFASRALISPRARSIPVVSSSNVLIHFPAPS